jgi:hypothetical protein
MIESIDIINIGPLCIDIGELSDERGISIISCFLQSGSLDLSNYSYFVASGDESFRVNG